MHGVAGVREQSQSLRQRETLPAACVLVLHELLQLRLEQQTVALEGLRLHLVLYELG